MPPPAKPNKRSADDATTEPSAKKRPLNGDIIKIEEEMPFNVSADLLEKYGFYPADICNRIESQFQGLIRAYVKRLMEDTLSKPKFSYNLMKEERTREMVGPTNKTITLRRGILSLSLANAILLDTHLEERNALPKITGRQKKTTFTEYELPENHKIANPDFIQQHAIRHNDIGWGFDCYKCLALYTISHDCGKQKDVYLYVRRVEIEVKKEETA